MTEDLQTLRNDKILELGSLDPSLIPENQEVDFSFVIETESVKAWITNKKRVSRCTILIFDKVDTKSDFKVGINCELSDLPKVYASTPSKGGFVLGFLPSEDLGRSSIKVSVRGSKEKGFKVTKLEVINVRD